MMIRYRFVFFTAVLFNILTLSAQNLPLHNFPVEINGKMIQNPWTGGLKSPQYSTADLNNDGIKDLFIFDKTGGVVLGYRNEGTNDEPNYTYSPDLVHNFPVLEDWALLRDYNNDGAVDIFGQLIESAIQGVAVWKGKWVGNRLSFERKVFPELTLDAIPVPSGGAGEFTQLFISTQDIPGIVDMDEDGDLDILTFSSVGGIIFLYKNMDVENGNSLETLEFIKDDDCWGRFFESGVVGCLDLSKDPEVCSMGRNGVHAGSTIAVFDGDDDGDMDIVLGDISFSNLVYAENTPENNHAWITNQDCNYPSYNTPLELVAFPAAYVLDVDNDGKRDMLVSPNTTTSGEDRNSLWFYKNRGTDKAPDFQLENQEFLIDEMVDVGNGANPAFFDYNADGLLDILVGNNSFWISGGSKDSRLQLFLNVGDAKNPAFKLEDDDFLGFSDLFISSANIFNFVPTFGDLDGDGDEDLLLGDNSGRLTYLENNAGPNATADFGNPQYGWMDIKIGGFSTPDIVDVNRDGLLDIVIGENTINFIDYTDTASSFNLFLNIGTAQEPMFVSSPNEAPNNPYFGFATTVDEGFNAGESAPCLYDTGDDFLMFSGCSSGRIKVFSNIDGNLDGKFERIHNNYGNLKSGWTTRLDVADINDDDVLDMIVGNRRGGFQFVETDFKTDGTVNVKRPTIINFSFKIYPNPAQGDLINIELANPNSSQGTIDLYATNGQLLMSEIVDNNDFQMPIRNLAAGIYFVKYQDNKGNRAVEKLVIY